MESSNNKHDAILITARKLFWKFGFKKVSIEEICREAEVSKMTFYKFFPNKLEVARKVFDNEAEKGMMEFKSIMREKTTAAQKLVKILQIKHQGTNEISRDFLADFYNNPELGLKAHIEKVTLNMWNVIISDFKVAQENGIFRKDFKPELLWYFSQKMIDMINDPQLSKMFSNPHDMIMELASFFVYGISGEKQ